MARTKAQGVVERTGQEVERPSGHDRDDERRRRDHRCRCRYDIRSDLRLDCDDDGGRAGQSADGGIEPQAAIGKRGDLWRRVWLDYRDVRWTKPKAKPAIEQGTPHFAGAHEYE